MTPDDDQFTDGRLGFSIRKPASWKFLPPAWSPLERAKRNLESDDFLRLAGKPFCCAVRQHAIQGIAYPTLQVVMRPFPMPPVESLPGILDASLAQAAQIHETLEVEQRLPHAIVAGYPSVGWSGTFVIASVEDGVETLFGVRARSHLVFARNLAFTIGLSGSDDPDYYDDAEFDAILSSVRIR